MASTEDGASMVLRNVTTHVHGINPTTIKLKYSPALLPRGLHTLPNIGNSF